MAIEELYARYTSAVDGGPLDDWPRLFIENGRYRMVSRDNRVRGLPLATMSCDSRAMMEDRVQALSDANFYIGRTVRHVVGLVHVVATDPPAEARRAWAVAASVAVFETVTRQPTTLLTSGTYEDVVVDTADGMRFAEKVCIYDSELVPNSIVYPL